MKRATLVSAVLCCTLLSAVQVGAQPTDNPILAAYPTVPGEDYSWTDEVKWSDVFNVADYGAVADGNHVGDGVGVTDNLPAFDAAIYDAWANGGGVVYVPAGTYYFSDHLLLRPGVVLRGDTPAVTDAQNPFFKPLSRLEFPKYFFRGDEVPPVTTPWDTAFKFIGTHDSNEASNQGLVWLDINRAGIAIASGGTEARNKIIFGTRTNNVAEPQPWTVPQLTLDTPDGTVPFQHEWQIHSMRFTDNISVFAGENVLVANNRCNDKHYNRDMSGTGAYLGDPAYVPPAGEETDDFRMPGYVVQDKKKVIGSDNDKYELVAYDGTQAIFSYTNHYGITVRGSSGTLGAAPYQAPSLFRPGVTIRDNWVYTTMRVGYHTSGYGLVIKDNIKKDLPGKSWWLHPNGNETVGNSNTLENRGIDFAGSDILIEGNDLQVQRHLLRTGPYMSVDGEGILLQECCGGTTMENVVIRDNSANAYIGLYKIPYLRDIEVTGNTLTGAGFIFVQADTNGSPYPLFDTLVDDNSIAGSGDIRIIGTSGGGGLVISNNTGSGSNKLRIIDDDTVAPGNALTTLSGNTGLDPATVVVQALDVRDYPVAELLMPAGGPDFASNPTVDVTVVVDGSFLVPAPVDVSELPGIATVSIYDDTDLIATLTTPTVTDPVSVRYEYTASWSPGPGRHQLSARVTPAGYSGSTTSTEWFTVTNVIHVDVAHTYDEWVATEFPGEDSPLVIGFGRDPDHDGLFNGIENLFGSAALVNSREPAPYVYEEDSTKYYTWRQIDDLGDLSMTVEEQANSFSMWSAVSETPEAVVDPSLPAGVSRYRIPLIDASELRAIRVRVEE